MTKGGDILKRLFAIKRDNNENIEDIDNQIKLISQKLSSVSKTSKEYRELLRQQQQLLEKKISFLRNSK